jgi:hypothetical protein
MQSAGWLSPLLLVLFLEILLFYNSFQKKLHSFFRRYGVPRLFSRLFQISMVSPDYCWASSTPEPACRGSAANIRVHTYGRSTPKAVVFKKSRRFTKTFFLLPGLVEQFYAGEFAEAFEVFGNVAIAGDTMQAI